MFCKFHCFILATVCVHATKTEFLLFPVGPVTRHTKVHAPRPWSAACSLRISPTPLVHLPPPAHSRPPRPRRGRAHIHRCKPITRASFHDHHQSTGLLYTRTPWASRSWRPPWTISHLAVRMCTSLAPYLILTAWSRHDIRQLC
jgi:hypothetical protein